MTKPLTQKEQVAVFVRYQPNCAVGDVSEALDMHGATAGKLLRELSDEGVLNGHVTAFSLPIRLLMRKFLR